MKKLDITDRQRAKRRREQTRERVASYRKRIHNKSNVKSQLEPTLEHINPNSEYFEPLRSKKKSFTNSSVSQIQANAKKKYNSVHK